MKQIFSWAEYLLQIRSRTQNATKNLRAIFTLYGRGDKINKK